MALKNANPTDTAALANSQILSTPPFEAEEDDSNTGTSIVQETQVTKVVAAAPAAAAEPAATTTVAPAAAATPAAAPAATGTALAPKGNTAVAVAGVGLNKLTLAKQAQNAIPTDTLEGMQLGTFPRLTITPGGFMQDKEKKLGDWIEFELTSWSYIWMVTTGAQNNPEANKLLRTSYDGVNIKDNGGSIAAYLASLKTEGYKDAASKKYIEVYGSLLSSEKGGVIDPDEQPFIQLSLSPQTVGKWEAFLLESTIKIARGAQQDGMLIRGSAFTKTLGPNTFGYGTFALAKK